MMIDGLLDCLAWLGLQLLGIINKLAPSVFPPTAEEAEWMNLHRWWVVLADVIDASWPA
jgi:hypothetical protein